MLHMAKVVETSESRDQFGRLPLTIQVRVREVYARLASWPRVSGAKPLRKEL